MLVEVAPLAVPEPLDPVPVAVADAEVVDENTNRSVAWKVWQFDDAGTRGV